MLQDRPGALGWIAMPILCAVSIGVRFALGDWLSTTAFLTFLPAVLLSTYLWGWLNGMVALVLSAVAAWFFFLPPVWTFTMDVSTGISLLVFLAVGGLDVVLVELLGVANRRLQHALHVRDGLFQEVRHRVANNMQAIAFMLGRVRLGVRENSTATLLAEAEARVSAMAGLQRRLHSPAGFAEGLESLLRDLLEECFAGLPVTLILAVHEARLPAERATALVLLVSEAATNAAKHVFRPGLGGLFEVRLAPESRGRWRLMIRDDGPGLSRARETDHPGEGLGMAIMSSLANQLGGELVIGDGPGLMLSVSFSVP